MKRMGASRLDSRMGSCSKQRKRWAISAVLTLVILGFLVLTLPGRMWPGPKYPLPMLVIALYFALATFGYVIAQRMTNQKTAAPWRDRLARVYPLIAWPLVVICIIGQFWWGWYVVLGVLGCRVFQVLREPAKRQRNLRVLLRWCWILDVVLIVYMLFSKDFFWR